MSGDAKNGQFLYDENTLQMMQKSGDFEITYCENALDFSDSNRFKKLELGTAQKNILVHLHKIFCLQLRLELLLMHI